MTTYRRHLLYTAMMLAALLTSCDNDMFHDAYSSTDMPMQIVPSVVGGTKASISTTDLTEFYLKVSCADKAYSYFEKVSKSGIGWSASKPLMWKNDTALTTYCAAYYDTYAFTDAEFADSADLTLPADQSTQARLNSADLLILTATETKYKDTDKGVLPVTLSHGLAKVNFVLTLGEAFYDAKIGLKANPVKAFTVKGANTGFSFKPMTGAVTVKSGTKADVTPLSGTYIPGTAEAKTDTAYYEVILVPQSFAVGELKVSFSVEKSTYEWTNASAITIEAGKTYNLPLSVTTAPEVDPYNGHEYVDMGLSVKWATCNVGASKPEEYGDYFAWGDTVPYYSSQDPLTWREKKTGYNWASYTWCEGSYKTMTKYCNDSNYGYNDFTDSKTTLDPEDDAASYNWGGSWRMPTKGDIEELLATKDNTTDYTWTWCDGNNTKYAGTDVKGWQIVRISTGATLFLPAAGYRYGTSLGNVGSNGYYWSSSLNTDYPGIACGLGFDSDDVGWGGSLRYYGQSVRPVCP